MPFADKPRTRKVCCSQTKHLQENYDYWIAQLKEMKSAAEREAALAGDVSLGQASTLEEIAETELESEHDNDNYHDNDLRQ